MQSTFSLVILSCICVVLADNKVSLPSYVTPCNISDKHLSQCVKEQIIVCLPKFTKGIPELKVPSLDPIKLDDIKIGGNGLDLTFFEASMEGISDSKVTDFKINLGEVDEEFSLSFKSNFTLKAKYEVDGRILILPIKGKGDAFVYAQGVEVQISSKLTHFKNNKGEHLKLATPTYKYDIELTTFDLQNLFNGNKQLADTTLQFANQNWKQLMDELAPPAIKQIVVTGVKAINKFFASVPISQMIIGYKETL
ncbi:unnamed protein product [Chilo suppressalis]|uniref:Uncharacterized protein n=1 Tax=Chilo suppressalis TaxID=168631 RepID=A0ABN8AXH8_CHISP|nr:hypothetical protein evm_010265 [Chilo suppressalis]CAH0397522.1 unnamed protein product [Chilo suppressalis]